MPDSITLELLRRTALSQTRTQGQVSNSLVSRFVERIQVLEATLLRLSKSADHEVSKIATEALGEMSE